jgi:hypothetical protein
LTSECTRGGGRELSPPAFGRFEEKKEIYQILIIKMKSI